MTFEHLSRTDQQALGRQLRHANKVRSDRMDQIMDDIHLAAAELDELARGHAPPSQAGEDNTAQRAVESPSARGLKNAPPPRSVLRPRPEERQTAPAGSSERPIQNANVPPAPKQAEAKSEPTASSAPQAPAQAEARAEPVNEPTPQARQAAPEPAPAREARQTAPSPESAPLQDEPQPAQADQARAEWPQRDFRTPDPDKPETRIPPIVEGDRGPLKSTSKTSSGDGGGKGSNGSGNGGGRGGGGAGFHKRAAQPNFTQSLANGMAVVRTNLGIVMGFTVFINILVLAIPIYLFQISDRVLTSRSMDTLVMLTAAVVGAVVLQAILDAVRRFILMRTAVEIAVQLGSPILSAAARASLHSNGRDYQVLGDLQQLRSFIVSGTLLSFLDAPMAPLFVLAVFLIHPQLGLIVVGASICLLIIAMINQRMTARPFTDANNLLSRAALHLDSMSRNSQIINALAMIPEVVRIWGRDTAASLQAQVRAQDRNIIMSSISKGVRLLTQVAMLGWGAFLAIQGEITGGMVIAGSIIAARALTPIEGTIEGWNGFSQFRASFGRIKGLLHSSPFNFERLLLPEPKGRLDVERLLFVPPPNKKVLLNGISFSLQPGESLAVIGNSGAGKTTLGKMLVGSILPTSGSVRLDLMDLRNWDQRQFGESIGYLPQDVQLFPGTIKANIARMREDVSDKDIFDAAVLADVHELIAGLSQGYETFVAGDGAPLSGGQKQRVALARAFFGNPKLVVLDEPNSNLDSQGETALAKALEHARKQKITVVTITQRPALLNVVDKILVLNNGSVSMFGTRSEVMAALTGKSGNSPTAINETKPSGEN
ncbi:ATP-binding cassette subfamily C protein [Devosia subaequoris]|uniref:ATP-binding cassette subfamily C protein n=1 Tax=Devosia subaequoris TaxID=395930 RepID=A0A7W6IPZ2_9HYPH|nr:type I secretion system permease/ATPase [Devosia subaequoris]MBB4052960.1 ATP-binding cassette subfamily C protein [Devosia subaequoris]MCP1210379.1 type I secretion system permease/ATPase [Devosia subaequoris]